MSILYVLRCMVLEQSSFDAEQSGNEGDVELAS